MAAAIKATTAARTHKLGLKDFINSPVVNGLEKRFEKVKNFKM